MKGFNFLSAVMALVLVLCSAPIVSARSIAGFVLLPAKIDGLNLKQIDEILQKALDKKEDSMNPESEIIHGDVKAQYKLEALFYRLMISVRTSDGLLTERQKIMLCYSIKPKLNIGWREQHIKNMLLHSFY